MSGLHDATNTGLIGAQGVTHIWVIAGTSDCLSSVPRSLCRVSFAPHPSFCFLLFQRSEVGTTQAHCDLSSWVATRANGWRSPLYCGSVFMRTQSGMGAVFGSSDRANGEQYRAVHCDVVAGALLMQLPYCWLSDPDGSTQLIFVALLSRGFPVRGVVHAPAVWALMVAAFFAGWYTPFISPFLGPTPTTLFPASWYVFCVCGLVFTFGLGAIAGAISHWSGRCKQVVRFAFGSCLVWLFCAIALYAFLLYDGQKSWLFQRCRNWELLSVLPTASPVAVGAAGEWAARSCGKPRREGQKQK